MSRQLSSLEEYFFYRSKWNLHSCFYTGIKLNKLPTRGQLNHTLSKLIKQFPQLHCNVQHTGSDKLVLTPFKSQSINFDDVVDYKDDWDEWNSDNINSIFKQYHFTYFVETPLWKLVIIPQLNTLLFVVDHVLTDGIGSIKFWQAFMKHLGPETDTNVLFKVTELEDNNNIINSLHPYDLWPISWSWKVKRSIIPFLVKFIPDLVTGLDPNLLQFNAYKFPQDLLDEESSEIFNYSIHNTNVHWTLNVPQDKLKLLLTDCKNHNVSLTSYIAATFAVALNKNINDAEDTNSGAKIKIDIPMNTRNVCQSMLGLDDSQLQMGNFVAGLEYVGERKDLENIWDVATLIQSSIIQSSQDKIDDTIQQVKLLDVVNIKDYILPKITNFGPGAAFEVTNLGFHEFEIDNDDFVVEDATFNQPQGISDIFSCCVVSSIKGGMNISISAPKKINDQLADVWTQVQTFF